MNPNLILDFTISISVLFVIYFNYSYHKSKPIEIPYEKIRTTAFQTRPETLGVFPEDSLKPYGAVMEIGFPGAVATMVAFLDGTADLCFSNGRRLTKGLTHALLHEAAFNFVKQTQKYIPMMHPVDSFPLPQKGHVRFYILTQNGIYSAEVNEKQLQNGESILTSLYRYGHYVITQLGKAKHYYKHFSSSA